MFKVKRCSLYELNSMVRDVISMSLPDSYWVEAELSEAREGYGGHCYLELIEKDEQSNTPIAKAHASCWRNRWMFIKPNFERITGQRIHAGMKVLLKVHAQFHENYGFSWIVDDIDPNYTMGDMARKRLEIINTLKAEGVFELQKELVLPMFCQRIAVISSATAAGYGDFCKQLADNDYGLQFQTRLFPATMQGEGVEQSVIAALDSINAEWEQFDCVDESVLDMISFQRVKTPTAAAAFLVNHLTEVYARVINAQEAIVQNVKHRLQVEKMRLDRLSNTIPVQFSLVKTKQGAYLDRLMSRLSTNVQSKISEAERHFEILSQNIQPILERKMLNESHRLQLLQQRIQAQDPELLLKRGYSITLKDGKSIRSASQLKAGDIIETRFAEGNIKSEVK